MPSAPSKPSQRRLTKRPANVPPPGPAAPPPAEAPETLRECLAPLAAAAMETSIMVYQWGLKNRQLMRASAVMDFAGVIVKECKRLADHEATAAQVQRDQEVQREVGVGGGAGQ